MIEAAGKQWLSFNVREGGSELRLRQSDCRTCRAIAAISGRLRRGPDREWPRADPIWFGYGVIPLFW